jgi:hypothetical protein
LPIVGRTPAAARRSIADRAGPIIFDNYLRAAQAYMLISMPTGTSTILGVFQVIPSSKKIWREFRTVLKSRTTSDITQVWNTRVRYLRITPDS